MRREQREREKENAGKASPPPNPSSLSLSSIPPAMEVPPAAPASTTALTAVAVDKDKNSLQALRWAVENLLSGFNHSIIVIHIKPPKHHHHGPSSSVEPATTAVAAADGHEPEPADIFLPIRTFCARKSIHAKEVVLEDDDVPRAIADYASANGIHNLVVGATSKNVANRIHDMVVGASGLHRKFIKGAGAAGHHVDVASTLIKSAPEFCAVYAIAKGKPATIRPARGLPSSPPPPSDPPAPSPSPWPPLFPRRELEDPVKTPFARLGNRAANQPAEKKTSFKKNAGEKAAPRPVKTSAAAVVGPRGSASADGDFFDKLGTPTFDHSDSGGGGGSSVESPDGASPISQRDMEAEMRRLKLELKQTMDMYSTACKEAITLKQKAKELDQLKMEEARKSEEARLEEAAALEAEKARCRAAMEAAEAARKLAETEAKRRQRAEMKARRESEEKIRALDALASTDYVRYRKYTIEEVEVSTGYFSEAMKIGEGGYGPVYRASLHHTPVAIKVLRPDATHGRKQFHQEVEVLSCIRHPNMVLLLGACPEYGCLVYEYMENGSLEDRLFRRGGTPPLSWPLRFRISAEIATALLFLHQTKPEPLVHRDLKPGNILLDRNFVSKVSDVGLSRLVPPSVADTVTQYRMTAAAGTFCYIDPEYAQMGLLGIRSDVYSLGVMLLQVVTGKPPMGLTHVVGRAVERGGFADVLDQTVEDWPVEEALGFARLALKCAELRKKDRPDLGTIVLPELNRLRNLGIAYEESRRAAVTAPVASR